MHTSNVFAELGCYARAIRVQSIVKIYMLLQSIELVNICFAQIVCLRIKLQSRIHTKEKAIIFRCLSRSVSVLEFHFDLLEFQKKNERVSVIPNKTSKMEMGRMIIFLKI